MKIDENGLSARSALIFALTEVGIITLSTPYPQSVETFQQVVDILSTGFSTDAKQARLLQQRLASHTRVPFQSPMLDRK
jgi:hypothetical protein